MLCRGIPQEFAEYLNYTKNLKFDETPDYKFIKGLFARAMKQEQITNDYEFDWFLTKDQRKAAKEGKNASDQPKSGAGGHYKMTFKAAKTA